VAVAALQGQPEPQRGRGEQRMSLDENRDVGPRRYVLAQASLNQN
jgi:hypothetical protein